MGFKIFTHLQRSMLFAISGLLCLTLNAQEYRSFDGSDNNPIHSEWGAVGTNQLHYGTVGFSDGISEPAGQNRRNPRVLSNKLFEQSQLLPDATRLSDYAWVWGQFIDHDITLVEDQPDETVNIQVPLGDVFFDPLKKGTVVIPMHRSKYDPATGTSTDNPRAWPNGISAFIDGSGVYGSTKDRADWLRSFEGGKFRMSAGNLLPYNTDNGELYGTIDPHAPEMAMPLQHVRKWFVAGDVRANENPLLTSMHTIFAREHNRLCEELALDNPSWDDERLYQQARKIVSGMIQSIVYNEWLPTMNVHLDEYEGYDAEVNPGIMNVFSAAAYRYGHTVINSELVAMDNFGNVVPNGHFLLRDAFFNPTVVKTLGVAPLLKGMATQVEQDFDCKMIDDLRNFLFGPPGAGGMDLAAININRGRERGLPDYNTVRENFGLPRHQSFDDITKSPELRQLLENELRDINNIDPWIGMLVEDHMSNTLFGESVMTILIKQFTALRDGDRFFFENDPGLSFRDRAWIRNTRLVDVVLRNTDAQHMQENIFLAEPHVTTAVNEDDDIAFEMRLFPNPTQGAFSIQLVSENSVNSNIWVIDQSGRQLLQKNIFLNKGENRIDLELPEGSRAGAHHVGVSIGNQRFYRVLVKLDN